MMFWILALTTIVVADFALYTQNRLCSITAAFILDTYYVVLVAWVVNAFFSTWRSDSPWGNPDLTGEEAVSYFINDIIGASTLGEDGRATRIVWRNVGFTFLSWFITFLCVAWG
jgi:SNF family Na+-dependent transporter